MNLSAFVPIVVGEKEGKNIWQLKDKLLNQIKSQNIHPASSGGVGSVVEKEATCVILVCAGFAFGN